MTPAFTTNLIQIILNGQSHGKVAGLFKELGQGAWPVFTSGVGLGGLTLTEGRNSKKLEEKSLSKGENE